MPSGRSEIIEFTRREPKCSFSDHDGQLIIIAARQFSGLLRDPSCPMR
jgi:hypothetical protein